MFKCDIVPNGTVTGNKFCFAVHFQREKQHEILSGKFNALWENIIITECPGNTEICTDEAK